MVVVFWLGLVVALIGVIAVVLVLPWPALVILAGLGLMGLAVWGASASQEHANREFDRRQREARAARSAAIAKEYEEDEEAA